MLSNASYYKELDSLCAVGAMHMDDDKRKAIGEHKAGFYRSERNFQKQSDFVRLAQNQRRRKRVASCQEEFRRQFKILRGRLRTELCSVQIAKLRIWSRQLKARIRRGFTRLRITDKLEPDYRAAIKLLW